MRAYEGYFIEQDRFISQGAVRLPLRKRAIVTILDEPAQEEMDDAGKRLKALDELNALVDASADEDMPPFERANLHREVVL